MVPRSAVLESMAHCGVQQSMCAVGDLALVCTADATLRVACAFFVTDCCVASVARPASNMAGQGAVTGIMEDHLVRSPHVTC